MAASKSSIEAGRGHVTLATDDTLLNKGLDAARNKFQTWAQGITAFASALEIAKKITDPFIKGMSTFSEWGAEIVTATRLTGIGFEAVQGFAIGMRVDLDSVVHSVAHMNAFLGELAKGAPEAAQGLQQLGLDATALLGPMSVEDRLRSFSEAIAGITDASQRGATARKIFGRGAITSDFSGGVEGLRGREARAREIGGVMSAADGQLVESYNKSLKEMQTSLRGLWSSIGAAAAPAMREFYDLLVKVFVATRVWSEENRPLLDMLFRIADKAVLAAGAIVGVGSAVYAGSYAMMFMKGTVGILGTFLTWLWGVTTFAASGFGILTVASWAWGIGSAVASGIVTAAIWLYNAATAVAHVMTWGWIAILVALGVAAIAVQVAIQAVVVGVVAFAAYMLWTRGVVQAVWERMVEVFQSSVNLITSIITKGVEIWKAIYGPFFNWFFNLFASSGESGPIGRFFGGLVDMATRAVASVIGLFSRIGSSISGAFTQTISGFTTMFSGLVDTGTNAFGALRDAFAVGDWEMMWAIVKTAAQLAWAQIVAFIEPTWNVWKDTAFDVWTEISTFLVDVFEKAWVKIKQVYTIAWAFLKAGFWDVAAELAESLYQTTRAAEYTKRAEGIRTRADNAVHNIGVEGAAAQRTRDQESIGAWFAEQARRVDRETPAEAARVQGELDSLAIGAWFAEQMLIVERDTAAEAGNVSEAARLQGELESLSISDWFAEQILNVERDTPAESDIARLQGELDSLSTEAWFAARIAEVNRQMTTETLEGEGFAAATGKQAASGSFFADALRASFGGGQVSAADRTARGIVRMVEQNDIIIRELQRIQPLGFA